MAVLHKGSMIPIPHTWARRHLAGLAWRTWADQALAAKDAEIEALRAELDRLRTGTTERAAGCGGRTPTGGGNRDGRGVRWVSG